MGERVWLTKTAYLQLKGQRAPHLIEASPHRPVLVELSDGVTPARNMKPEAKRPEKPLSGYVKKQSTTTRPAHQQKQDPSKRAADQ